MIITDASRNTVTCIGRLGENEARVIRINVSQIKKAFPDASYTVLHRRPGDADAYPVNSSYVELDGENVLWTVASGDLATAGAGQFEIRASVDDAVVKSVIYNSRIDTALDGSGTAPEPWESWVEDVEDAADRAEAAAELLENPGAEATTLEPGNDATASYSEGTFSFGIPKGAKGDTGDTGPSPVITTSKNGKTTTIYSNGESVGTVMDGSDGDPSALIAVQDEEPTDPSAAIWLTETPPTAVQVPTYGEFQGLLSAIGVIEPAEYDATATYSVGDLCWHENAMYRCNTAISTAEAWTAAHWTQIAFPRDVRVNGSSVVDANGVANVPMASSSDLGAVKINYDLGITRGSDGTIGLVKAQENIIKTGTNNFHPIVSSNQHISSFYGLAKAAGDSTQSSSNNAVGTYTETALSKISDMLNAPVSVSGSTPSITAKSGVRYACGEVSTLTVVLPSSGCVDVVFESGSTATVLTITPPTGKTVKWPAWFDPTALAANSVYEINIMDGVYGAVGVWS